MITEVYAKENGAAASTNGRPAAKVRGPDDEPEPPMLMLLGVAKHAGASVGWWWLPILLVLLAGVYLYGRLKNHLQGRDESKD